MVAVASSCSLANIEASTPAHWTNTPPVVGRPRGWLPAPPTPKPPHPCAIARIAEVTTAPPDAVSAAPCRLPWQSSRLYHVGGTHAGSPVIRRGAIACGYCGRSLQASTDSQAPRTSAPRGRMRSRLPAEKSIACRQLSRELRCAPLMAGWVGGRLAPVVRLPAKRCQKSLQQRGRCAACCQLLWQPHRSRESDGARLQPGAIAARQLGARAA